MIKFLRELSIDKIPKLDYHYKIKEIFLLMRIAIKSTIHNLKIV